MAKAFYTQSEAQAALNTDEEGLKALTREGRLTEYRDGPNLMYKGTQVESVASEMGRGDAVELSDTGGPIGMADSGGASGSAIGLADSSPPRADSGASRTGTGSGSGTGIAGGSTGGGMMAKDDTAGGFTLSDSDTGVDPVMGSAAGASASGITIFGPDDSMADPGAQTNLGDSSSEQVNLEGIGSGSGLLDLTQEPDDTSFGAETFDEIMPGESGMGTAVGYEHDDAGIDTGAAPTGTRAVGVVYEPADPSAPLFGGLAGGTAAVVLVGLLAVAASAMGAAPGLMSMFFNDDGTLNLAILLGVFLGLPILGLIIGMVGGKMSNA